MLHELLHIDISVHCIYSTILSVHARSLTWEYNYAMEHF